MRIIRFWCGIPPLWVQNLHYHELIRLAEAPDARAAAVAKDVALVLFAQLPRYADAVFLDCDAELTNAFELPATGAAFGFCRGIADTSIVAVNGDHETFRRIEAEKLRRNIQDCYGWPRKILRRMRVNEIRESMYSHRGDTLSSIKRRQK